VAFTLALPPSDFTIEKEIVSCMCQQTQIMQETTIPRWRNASIVAQIGEGIETWILSQT